jgi:hypothetical protein
MIVTILYRLAGSPVNPITDIDVGDEVPGSSHIGPAIGAYASSPFSDVAQGEYYTDAVIWAAANGIVSGYGNGKYGPEDNITREQLATILNNYANKKGLPLPETRDYPGFNDDRDIANYAKEAIERFFKAEVINGKPGNLFDPKGNATRAEVAAMLMNFLKTVK